MNILFKTNSDNVNWNEVRAMLEEVDLACTSPEIHQISFNNSYTKVFVYKDAELIAFGRILSDGVRQSAIYDLAIKKEYQGLRLGTKMLSYLMGTTPDCNFILYASPGKEGFYEKIGFKKMKTGMIKFQEISKMSDLRFIE